MNLINDVRSMKDQSKQIASQTDLKLDNKEMLRGAKSDFKLDMHAQTTSSRKRGSLNSTNAHTKTSNVRFSASTRRLESGHPYTANRAESDTLIAN